MPISLKTLDTFGDSGAWYNTNKTFESRQWYTWPQCLGPKYQYKR